MLKLGRLVLVLMVLVMVLGQAVAPVSAKAIECDEDLFLAGMFTAFHDPTRPQLDWYEMHWSYADGNYQVDYVWQSGIGGVVQTVTVRQNKRVVGVATNKVWRVCHPSQAWRKYLMEHYPVVGIGT